MKEGRNPERTLLGGVLTGPVDPVGLGVHQEWLSEPGRKTWDACLRCHGETGRVDTTYVYEALRAVSSRPDDVAQYLSQLCAGAAEALDVRQAVDELRSNWVERNLTSISNRLASMRPDKPELGSAIESLREIQLGLLDSSTAVPLSACVADYHDDVCGDTGGAKTLTYLDSLDDVTGGIHAGELTVLAGRPGMGKSCACVCLCVNAAQRGKRTLYVSLEDSRRRVWQRMLSRYCRIDTFAWLRSRTDEERAKIVRAYDSFSGLPLVVSDRPATSMGVVDLVRLEHRRNKLDLVIVDHIGQVKNLRGADRFSVYSDTTLQFAECAKELDVPFLAAHQMNRTGEDTADKRPALHQLRGSGEIEQIARAVWLLYRPEYYFADDPSMVGRLEWIVAKSNHGRTGTVESNCDMRYMDIWR